MKTGTHAAFALLLVIIAISVTLSLVPRVSAAPPLKSGPVAAQTNSSPQKVKSPATPKPATKKQITGAELYSINCNRCHPERYPTERTAAQWKTIMLHMQVRANIPVSQAKLILKYLQDNSGR